MPLGLYNWESRFLDYSNKIHSVSSTTACIVSSFLSATSGIFEFIYYARYQRRNAGKHHWQFLALVSQFLSRQHSIGYLVVHYWDRCTEVALLRYSSSSVYYCLRMRVVFCLVAYFPSIYYLLHYFSLSFHVWELNDYFAVTRRHAARRRHRAAEPFCYSQ